MRPRSFQILVFVPLLLAAPGSSGRDRQVSEALVRGLEYLALSAADPAHFERYASDYLFCMADLADDPDPWLSERARELGRELGQRYLAEGFTLDSPDEVLDAASALAALDRLEVDVDGALLLVRAAAAGWSAAEYLDCDWTAGEWPDVDRLVDWVIDLHFTDAMRVPVGVSYAEALLHVPAVEYLEALELDLTDYIDCNNLVTHLVYTLSGYGRWNPDPAALPRELEYLHTGLPLALAWGDPETLGEYVDSLKLLGLSAAEEPSLTDAERLLLELQRPDGRWEPDGAEEEYDRYHATWCAMDALRDWELGSVGWPDDLSRELFRRWAEQRARGSPPEPVLPVLGQ